MDGVVLGLLLLTVVVQSLSIGMLRSRLNDIDHEAEWLTAMASALATESDIFTTSSGNRSAGSRGSQA